MTSSVWSQTHSKSTCSDARFSAPILVLVSLLAAFAVSAQAEGARPFRAARLTFLQGDVHVEQVNSSTPSSAALNMPLVEGTVLSTGEDGQAEMEFEDGSLVRLTPNSGVSLLNLSVDSSGDYQTRIGLLNGLTYLELRAGTKFQYSVDAGGDMISPVENSTIRVNFDEPPAVIAVLDGTAHLAAASGAYTDATAGQTVRNDSSQGGIYMVKPAIAPESWDQWNEDRDQAAANEAGSQTEARSKFAGDQGYGWADLDANGSWYDVPGQGEVWQPYDATLADSGPGVDSSGADGGGFDPYSYGSWAYTPAGYVWASGYGWGWLPYRCGHWAYWPGFGWGWSPGYGCGLFGFGGYGYDGFVYGGVNIGSAPPGYRRPRRPIPGPGPVHPLQHGRGGPVPIAPVRAFNGGGVTSGSTAKTIAGKTVEPLPPIGGGYTPRGGSAIGSALLRDYPVDTATHEPVTGLVAEHGTVSASSDIRAAWHPASQVNRGGPPRAPYVQRQGGYLPQQRSSYAHQGQGGVRPAPASRPPTPAQRSSPAPASHAAPAAAAPSKGKQRFIARKQVGFHAPRTPKLRAYWRGDRQSPLCALRSDRVLAGAMLRQLSERLHRAGSGG